MNVFYLRKINVVNNWNINDNSFEYYWISGKWFTTSITTTNYGSNHKIVRTFDLIDPK
jgi:hypothetical protein